MYLPTIAFSVPVEIHGVRRDFPPVRASGDVVPVAPPYLWQRQLHLLSDYRVPGAEEPFMHLPLVKNGGSLVFWFVLR